MRIYGRNRSNSRLGRSPAPITKGKMINRVPEDLALDSRNGQVGMALPTVTKQPAIQAVSSPRLNDGVADALGWVTEKKSQAQVSHSVKGELKSWRGKTKKAGLRVQRPLTACLTLLSASQTGAARLGNGMVRISLRLALPSSISRLAVCSKIIALVCVPSTWLPIEQYLAINSCKGINIRDDVLEESCAAKVCSKHVLLSQQSHVTGKWSKDFLAYAQVSTVGSSSCCKLVCLAGQPIVSTILW